MKTIKLVISAGFFAIAWFWGLVCRLAGKKPAADGVILYYHAIPAEQRHLFARQMDVLVHLTKPTKLDSELFPDSETRYSAVTFDDGFVNVLENALPELEKRKIPATIFVVTDRMGDYPDWYPESAQYERHQKIASAEQLRQLPTDLITIGSHTMRHPMLTTLNEEGARQELYQSRMKLEALLDRKVTLFSFPFGDFNPRLIEWCREAGYKRVFTSLPVAAFREPASFAMGRVPVNPTDSLLEFRMKVLGAYRWLPHAIVLKRRVLSPLRRIRAQPIPAGNS
jgi:peptidoglycan/xylan/chitin deacetylase (PgdA/CDA1 family)